MNDFSLKAETTNKSRAPQLTTGVSTTWELESRWIRADGLSKLKNREIISWSHCWHEQKNPRKALESGMRKAKKNWLKHPRRSHPSSPQIPYRKQTSRHGALSTAKFTGEGYEQRHFWGRPTGKDHHQQPPARLPQLSCRVSAAHLRLSGRKTLSSLTGKRTYRHWQLKVSLRKSDPAVWPIPTPLCKAPSSRTCLPTRVKRRTRKQSLTLKSDSQGPWNIREILQFER